MDTDQRERGLSVRLSLHNVAPHLLGEKSLSHICLPFMFKNMWRFCYCHSCSDMQTASTKPACWDKHLIKPVRLWTSMGSITRSHLCFMTHGPCTDFIQSPSVRLGCLMWLSLSILLLYSFYLLLCEVGGIFVPSTPNWNTIYNLGDFLGYQERGTLSRQFLPVFEEEAQ